MISGKTPFNVSFKQIEVRSPNFWMSYILHHQMANLPNRTFVYIGGGHFRPVGCILPRRSGRILAVSLWDKGSALPRCHSGQWISLFLGKGLWLSRWPYWWCLCKLFDKWKVCLKPDHWKEFTQNKNSAQRHKWEIQNPKIYSFRTWNDTLNMNRDL